MSADNRYNGWKNYETWNVALWLGNGDYVSCEASDFRDLRAFADAIRDELVGRAYVAIGSTGMFFNLLGAALWVVDWEAVAEMLADGYFNESADEDEDEGEAE